MYDNHLSTRIRTRLQLIGHPMKMSAVTHSQMIYVIAVLFLGSA